MKVAWAINSMLNNLWCKCGTTFSSGGETTDWTGVATSLFLQKSLDSLKITRSENTQLNLKFLELKLQYFLKSFIYVLNHVIIFTPLQVWPFLKPLLIKAIPEA